MASLRGSWAGAWLGLWAALGWPLVATGTGSGSTSAPRGEPAERVDLGELWQQAQARIETADYAEAIVILTRVYEAIAADPEAEALRMRVQWALHRAHMGAWGVDGEASHLYMAGDLLNNYLAALPASEVDRRAAATSALAEVEAIIDRHEAQAELEVRPEREVEREVEPEVEREPEAEVAPPLATPASNRPLIVGGAIGVGVGLAGLGVMAGGLGYANAAIGRFETQPEERAAARRDIGRGNTIAIAAGAAGGVLLVGSAVVLALGLKRRSRAGGSLAAGPTPLGVGWLTRF